MKTVDLLVPVTRSSGPECADGDRVFALWHVHHANQKRHRDMVGRVRIGRRDEDNVKFLGVFSTSSLATQAITQYQGVVGFKDEPDCFILEEMQMNADLL